MDALAVAYNAAFICEHAKIAHIARFAHMPRAPFGFSPRGILRRFSFAEIASICEDIISNAEVERGFNKNYPDSPAKGRR